jgi:hypothetical protein
MLRGRGIANLLISICKLIGNAALKLVDGVVNFLIGCINAIIALINPILKIINNIFGTNLSVNKVPAWTAPSLDVIPTLAEGGIPSYGQLFVAREAGPELVGRFGNMTAVMNNDQIVEAVAGGVYSAVTAAMAGNNSSDQPLNVTLRVGETDFGKIVSIRSIRSAECKALSIWQFSKERILPPGKTQKASCVGT